jgi:uncharacterized protein YkwD
MRLILSVFFILITFLSFAQDGVEPYTLSHYLQKLPAELVTQCNTAQNISGMNQQEKDVVLITNLVRVNPKLFLQVFLNDYVQTSEFYTMQNPYVVSLQKELQQVKPLPPLKVEVFINQTAAGHAVFCGSTGHIGHKNFNQRSADITKKLKHDLVGENCGYIRTHALDFVMDLLIDEDVPSLGHRKNILSSMYAFTGVSIRKFKDGEYCLIQIFSGKSGLMRK